MNSKVAGIALLSAAGCLAVGWHLVARFSGRARPRFPYLATELSEAKYDTLALKSGWAKAQLDVPNNVRLRGLVRPPSNPGQDWVIYFPGNDRTQLATGQGFLERLALGRDLGLAVFSYRGFDGSGGKPEYRELAADAPRILNGLCRQQHVDAGKVHVIGFSIGSHFAVIASRAANLAGHPVKSLSLLACVNDITMVRRSPWEKLSLGDHYATEPLLDGVPRPVLLLQGTADEALGGAQQALVVARALGNRARYEPFAGVGHEALLYHEPAAVRLREFISSP